jgi:hypothetical protein
LLLQVESDNPLHGGARTLEPVPAPVILVGFNERLNRCNCFVFSFGFVSFNYISPSENTS